MAHEELIKEIALRPHHLDAVSPGLARPGGRRVHVGDLLFDPGLVQFAGHERRDRRLHRTGRNTVPAIAVAPGVQDLHGDPPAFVVHRFGDDAVVGDIGAGKQPRRPRKHPALAVRRHAPRHHQPDTPARPRRIERRHPVPVAGFLQPGVHRPHQHAVFQRDMAEIKRCQHMRIGIHRSPPKLGRSCRLRRAKSPETPRHPARPGPGFCAEIPRRCCSFAAQQSGLDQGLGSLTSFRANSI